jgi:hypothetical protein
MAVMARTSKKKAPTASGRQAPAGAWSPETLLSALKSGTDADKLEALKKAGILDASGNLTKTYKNWGSKVTRTPDALEVEK